MKTSIQQHWQHIYQTKQAHEVSWTQEVPETSLGFINSFELPKNAPIIDIGGGDSKLVDHLLKLGYTDLTVLDISEESLERAKQRLGKDADKIHWIVSDIRDFTPGRKYAVWHDRAAFHFLVSAEEVKEYLQLVRQHVDGYLIVGTFSENGPTKCSGLPIKQYSDTQLTDLFTQGFNKIRCINVDHITPAKAVQNFTFCSFKSKAA